jgi:hypothetical protein
VLKVNSQLMLVTGIDSSNKIELYSLKQLIVSDDDYLKLVIKAVDGAEYSRLDTNRNSKIFTEIREKVDNHYKGLPSEKLRKTLANSSFASASIEVQAKAIVQILRHFNRGECNLKSIGGSSDYRYRIVYSGMKPKIILNVQSVTGLFSHEIDLSAQ